MRTWWSDIIADLFHRVEDLERRYQSHRRTGTVHEVDAAKGLARVKLGEDHKTGRPYLSPWMPWTMPAMGAAKVNIPPSVGQQVELVSETGDLTDGVINASLRSNDNPQPDAQPGEGVITSGSTRIFFDGNTVRITAATIVLDGTVHLGGDGGKLVHRKDDVDDAGNKAVESATKVYAV